MSFLSKVVLPQDKANHAVYGTLIYAAIAPFDKQLAVGVVVVVAALKELLYDKIMGKGTPDFYDFAATVAIPMGLYVSS